MEEFWEILVSIKNASEAAGVQIVTGDTKVVEKGKGDKIFINTSGIGVIHPQANISFNRVSPGDKIIVSGNIATHGVAILSQRKGLEFETSMESDTAPLNGIVKNLLDTIGTDVHFMRDPTRGGVATVMNELAGQCKLGIDIIQKAIPTLEEVEGACEMLGLDPLYVANEGVFVCVVNATRAEEALQTLRQHPFGKNAAIIGEVTAQHAGQVVLTSKIGGRRVVNYLTGEQLPRIC